MLKRVILFSYIGGLLLFVANFQAISDWWFLRGYQVSPQIEVLADNTAMNDNGRQLFYVSDPELNNKREFNSNCPVIEQALVLGCYSTGKIFILEVDRPELAGVKDVTAAHEMLHAAYTRLGRKERGRIDALLEAEFAKVTNPKLIDLIASYEQTGGIEVRRNELHSVLPTQLISLGPELEEYYARYFDNRSRVAEIYQDYEDVFLQLNQQIKDLQSDIQVIRGELADVESKINLKRAQINALNEELARLRRERRLEEYNELVPEQNALVREYNLLVERYRNLISEHNEKVVKVNDLVLLQNDLVNSIDSTKFETL